MPISFFLTFFLMNFSFISEVFCTVWKGWCFFFQLENFYCIRLCSGDVNYKLSSLTREVDRWLQQFDSTVTFEPEYALKKLQELQLINATEIGKLYKDILIDY